MSLFDIIIKPSRLKAQSSERKKLRLRFKSSSCARLYYKPLEDWTWTLELLPNSSFTSWIIICWPSAGEIDLWLGSSQLMSCEAQTPHIEDGGNSSWPLSRAKRPLSFGKVIASSGHGHPPKCVD